MWESQTGSLLLDYYEAFLRDRDLDQFREQVTARYTEGTLGRVLTSSPSIAARRAAVLALGVTGSFEQSNTALGRALRDNDPIVRTMAESALWAIWFRADSPENNQNLEEVRLLIGHRRVDAAVNAASRLIARAPKYAEAYNQRAIALFIQGRFAESAEDCQRVLKLNPYHVGAISGLAQCQMLLNQPHEALRTLRRPTRHCERCAVPRSCSRTACQFARTSRFWKHRSNRTERGRSRSLIVALMRVGRGGSQEGSARPCTDGRLSDGRWGPANAATTSGSAPR